MNVLYDARTRSTRKIPLPGEPMEFINLRLSTPPPLFLGQLRVHVPRVRAYGAVPLPPLLPADTRRLRVAPLGLKGKGQHGQHARGGLHHALLLHTGEEEEDELHFCARVLCSLAGGTSLGRYGLSVAKPVPVLKVS